MRARRQWGVVPVTLREHDLELGVDVRRVVAFRGRCRCSWRSPSRPSYRGALELLREHRRATGH